MFSDPEKNIEQLGLQPAMSVADMGTGSGFYAMEASKRVGSGGKVYAVDVQKDLLQKLKNTATNLRAFNIEVVWGDIEKIGGTRLRDACVDRVISSNVLFQVTDKNSYVLEIKRILKSGGKVMVIDWSGVTPLGPKTLVSETQARQLFEKAGFTALNSFNAGDHHYGIIFQKQ
jgi:ubiquinone/menaquinone biosynthesis C-methylase UbiE